MAMKINYQKARTLCTDAEFKLLSATKPKELVAHTPAGLRKLSNQARKYSDKWLEQSRKQGNSTTGAAARSFEKHELFKEALERIDAKLAKTEAVVKKAPAKKTTAKKADAKKAVKKATKKVASKKAKKAVAKKAAKKAASTRARGAMSLAKQAKQRSIGTGMRMAASGQNSRIRGHVSAQGRRNQAARSARKR